MKILPLILGIIVFIVAIAMKIIGESSSHLSELADIWFYLLPLGIIFIVLAFKKKK